jgi:hypothetical protein
MTRPRPKHGDVTPDPKARKSTRETAMKKSSRGAQIRQSMVGRAGPLSSPGLLPLVVPVPTKPQDEQDQAPA